MEPPPNPLASLPPHLQTLFPGDLPPDAHPVYGPLYAKPIPPNVLSVTVKKCDPFRSDALITNPVVRMHVLDPATGNYMRNLVTPGISLDQVSQAMVSGVTLHNTSDAEVMRCVPEHTMYFHFECPVRNRPPYTTGKNYALSSEPPNRHGHASPGTVCGGSGTPRTDVHHHTTPTDAHRVPPVLMNRMQMLAYPGRPATVTVANPSGQPMPAIQEYLPPVQTGPYDLLVRPDSRNTAKWNEALVIDEATERLVALDALIIFEVGVWKLGALGEFECDCKGCRTRDNGSECVEAWMHVTLLDVLLQAIGSTVANNEHT